MCAVRRRPRRGRVAAFRPGLRCCIRNSDSRRWRSVRVEGRDMQDTERRFVCRSGTQRDFEPLPVRVGHRQPENPVPVPACGQRVDQWLKYLGVVADEEPGSSLRSRLSASRTAVRWTAHQRLLLPARSRSGSPWCELGVRGRWLRSGRTRLLTDPVLAMLRTDRWAGRACAPVPAGRRRSRAGGRGRTRRQGLR